jgi:threonylcarbamoyladenosine tRNA methylthiotransferase MtaB
MNAPVFATLGCRLNAYETEAMKELSAAAGVENAVIVNTCAVTAEAVRQAKQEIRRLSPRTSGGGDHRHGLRGADRSRDLCRHARSRARHRQRREDAGRDLGGPARPDLIGVTEKVQVDDIMSVRETAGHLIDGFERHRAYVQVQNGCDHRCTFCIIPYGRGNSRSVPAGVVVEQIKRLVGKGFNEVVLTGVDLTAGGRTCPRSRGSAIW